MENVRYAKTKPRGQWQNKTQFLLSCFSYAIGLGNIWRFPYLCYRNGGGAFLVPYLIMLFFCGIPLFLMESSLGQFASRGCISVFRMSPLFKGAGYATILVNFIVITYFNTVCSYPLLFLYHCFQAKLPWSDCGNPWNTEHCAPLTGRNGSKAAANATLLLTNGIGHEKLKTPADEFFHNKILHLSSGIEEIGDIVWPLLICSLISWALNYLCIIRGIKSVGKAVYFTSTFPFVVLFILLIRGITLPGAMNGIHFYIWPKWEELFNIKIWADAACQIFFSLGPGWGGIVYMASYNDFRNKNKLDSIIVPICNSGTSIFAGFVVFSVIGYMSHETGLPIATVATSGPGLAFVTYPEAISLMPLSHIWAVLFFLMLFFLGIGSMFVSIITIVSGIIDEYPGLRKWQHWVTICVVLILMSISVLYTTNGGMYWLQLFDWYSASISVVLVCLVEVIMVGWTYGINNFIRDVEFMTQEKLWPIWYFLWKIITPGILIFIFGTVLLFNTNVTYGGKDYPDWAIRAGWCSCFASMMCIPLYMGYRLLYLEEGDLIDRIKSSLNARADWAPAKEEEKREWAKLVLREYFNSEDERENDPYHEQFLKLCVAET